MPLPVGLFGAIYAIALAAAPSSSSAASQTARAHDERLIDGDRRPVAHTPRVPVILNTQTTTALGGFFIDSVHTRGEFPDP